MCTSAQRTATTCAVWMRGSGNAALLCSEEPEHVVSTARGWAGRIRCDVLGTVWSSWRVESYEVRVGDKHMCILDLWMTEME